MGDVRLFVRLYPHPIHLVVAHPPCGDCNWASHRTWTRKISDGSTWKAIDTVLWSLHIGAYASVEQPPSAV
eukprot:924223-Pleurochrysis_carterae.AAC.1